MQHFSHKKQEKEKEKEVHTQFFTTQARVLSFHSTSNNIFDFHIQHKLRNIHIIPFPHNKVQSKPQLKGYFNINFRASIFPYNFQERVNMHLCLCTSET